MVCYLNIETFWEHIVDRSIWELDNICMKGKCVICKLAHSLGYTINKGDTMVADYY